MTHTTTKTITIDMASKLEDRIAAIENVIRNCSWIVETRYNENAYNGGGAIITTIKTGVTTHGFSEADVNRAVARFGEDWVPGYLNAVIDAYRERLAQGIKPHEVKVASTTTITGADTTVRKVVPNPEPDAKYRLGSSEPIADSPVSRLRQWWSTTRLSRWSRWDWLNEAALILMLSSLIVLFHPTLWTMLAFSAFGYCKAAIDYKRDSWIDTLEHRAALAETGGQP